jgi:hypothetical protein
MKPTESRARKPFRLLVCALIVGTTVAAPLLERDGFRTWASLESAHDPAACVHAHDHRFCTQVGTSRALPAHAHDYRVAHVILDAVWAADARSNADRPVLERPGARAPPLV